MEDAALKFSQYEETQLLKLVLQLSPSGMCAQGSKIIILLCKRPCTLLFKLKLPMFLSSLRPDIPVFILYRFHASTFKRSRQCATDHD